MRKIDILIKALEYFKKNSIGGSIDHGVCVFKFVDYTYDKDTDELRIYVEDSSSNKKELYWDTVFTPDLFLKPRKDKDGDWYRIIDTGFSKEKDYNIDDYWFFKISTKENYILLKDIARHQFNYLL